MQTAVPQVMDISRESKQVWTCMAHNQAPPARQQLSFGRRLIEQGVRFVQLHDWGWDFHGTNPNEAITEGLRTKCRPMDRAVTASFATSNTRPIGRNAGDLGGEFGRSPSAKANRRQHQPGPRPSSLRLHSLPGRAASNPGSVMAPPTNLVSTWAIIRSMSTICRPPSSTCSASSTPV